MALLDTRETRKAKPRCGTLQVEKSSTAKVALHAAVRMSFNGRSDTILRIGLLVFVTMRASGRRGVRDLGLGGGEVIWFCGER